MHTHSTKAWQHGHTFAQDKKLQGERRTLMVLVLTLITMTVEIVAGIMFGSIALLADGLHMGSHATALGINAFAYAYARKHADSPRFTFGTGKVNALGGFTGAILLAVFAVSMVWGSVDRLLNPIPIVFNWAIAVAVIGLAVNAISVFLLDVDDHHHHHHGADHHHEHHDLNLRSAYLHVLADALTSVLAIGALLAGKYLGAIWMDPLMGLVGAVLVIRWSWGLLKETSTKLLDHQAPEEIQEAVRSAIEGQADNRIYDLHIWSVAPGKYAAIIGIITHSPHAPDHYKTLIPEHLRIEHITIEVQACSDAEPTYKAA
jgi:cation diffusion facilitator family transporter